MLPEPATLSWQASGEWFEATSLLLLKQILEENLTGKTAFVSSFGAESAVLLHLVSRIDKTVPVLFIDTQMMFQETLDYQVELSETLGFSDIRRVTADAQQLRREDVFGRLHKKNPDACCQLRKTVPLENALEGFDAWITGRKRHQSPTRANLRPVEAEANGRIKVNPLLHWDRQDIENYFDQYDLPRHPLISKGYMSIGCAPCTAKTGAGEDPRSGRWKDNEKTECGIHFENGKIVGKSA